MKVDYIVRLTLDAPGTYYRYGATRDETFDYSETTWTIDRARRFASPEAAEKWLKRRPALLMDIFRSVEVVTVREAYRDLHARIEKKS